MDGRYFVRAQRIPGSRPWDASYEVCEHPGNGADHEKPRGKVIQEFRREADHQGPKQAGKEPWWRVRGRAETLAQELNTGGAARERALRKREEGT